MQQPYQFSFHDRVSPTPPQCYVWDLVTSGNELTRVEKDQIFHALQGNSGRSEYRVGGWAFPIGQFMKTYLVEYDYSGWQTIKAFDKTCIRSSYHTNNRILRIVELVKKGREFFAVEAD